MLLPKRMGRRLLDVNVRRVEGRYFSDARQKKVGGRMEECQEDVGVPGGCNSASQVYGVVPGEWRSTMWMDEWQEDGIVPGGWMSARWMDECQEDGIVPGGWRSDRRMEECQEDGGVPGGWNSTRKME